MKRADGVRVHLSPRTDDGRLVRAEIRDITDHCDAKHREELFWRVLQHDIRNKSAIVAGYAEEIVDGDDPEQMRAAASTIADAAMELGNVATSVRQIQQAVTADPGDREVRDDATAVSDVVAECRADYPDAELTVTEREAVGTSTDRAFPCALRHAVENAIVHNDTPTPSVEIHVGRAPNTGRAEIGVLDRNPPIDDAELDVLFRLAARTSTRHGSGVGRDALVCGVPGGRVGVERRTRRGNVVRFYLPPKPGPDDYGLGSGT